MPTAQHNNQSCSHTRYADFSNDGGDGETDSGSGDASSRLLGGESERREHRSVGDDIEGGSGRGMPATSTASRSYGAARAEREREQRGGKANGDQGSGGSGGGGDDDNDSGGYCCLTCFAGCIVPHGGSDDRSPWIQVGCRGGDRHGMTWMECGGRELDLKPFRM